MTPARVNWHRFLSGALLQIPHSHPILMMHPNNKPLLVRSAGSRAADLFSAAGGDQSTATSLVCNHQTGSGAGAEGALILLNCNHSHAGGGDSSLSLLDATAAGGESAARCPSPESVATSNQWCFQEAEVPSAPTTAGGFLKNKQNRKRRVLLNETIRQSFSLLGR